MPCRAPIWAKWIEGSCAGREARRGRSTRLGRNIAHSVHTWWITSSSRGSAGRCGPHRPARALGRTEETTALASRWLFPSLGEPLDSVVTSGRSERAGLRPARNPEDRSAGGTGSDDHSMSPRRRRHAGARSARTGGVGRRMPCLRATSGRRPAARGRRERAIRCSLLKARARDQTLRRASLLPPPRTTSPSGALL